MNKVYDIGSDVEILEKTDSESKTLYVDDDNTLVASQQLIFSEKGVRRRQSPAPATDGSQLMKNSKKEKWKTVATIEIFVQKIYIIWFNRLRNKLFPRLLGKFNPHRLQKDIQKQINLEKKPGTFFRPNRMEEF